jgi:Domain of unknown function (DUF4168)
MIKSSLSRLYSHKIFAQSLVVIALAGIGVLSGVTPEMSKDSHTLVFSSSVYAQTAPTEAEITNYAKAVLAMEPLRQNAYNEIKKIMSGAVPDIQCYRTESINSLNPAEARQIAQNYCKQALALVENYLTSARFNQITQMADNDPNLRQKIKEKMRQLQ